MPLALDPWRADKQLKVAKLARNIAQDVQKAFKTDTLRKLFPEKIVNKVDIGERCYDWAYKVTTFFKDTERLMTELLTMIRMDYILSINPDDDEIWLDFMSIYGMVSFAHKINSMPHISELSFMDKDEHIGKEREDIGSANW